MKIIKNIFLITLLTVLSISCGNVNESKVEKQTEVVKQLPAKLVSVEVEIEGMTCEIGCARLIQSKLYKTEGVKFAKVSFEEKNGIITFDSNQITNEDITNVIEKIAGGDLYKVVEIEKVEELLGNSEEI